MHAGLVDVGGVVLVRRRDLAENLILHHFGEAEDGVERRTQLVAHLRQKARLRDVGGFRAAARFVGLVALGLFEFTDQRVLFGARLDGRQRRAVDAQRKQREVTERRDHHGRKDDSPERCP